MLSADEIADHCVDVAMHPNGCCVLQKCLASSEGEQRERLLVEIISNALILSQDQYGYVSLVSYPYVSLITYPISYTFGLVCCVDDIFVRK